MQLNNPNDVMNHLIKLLATHGIEAFIGKVKPDYEDGELEDGLRIPEWENENQELSRKAIYQWIFSKLKENPRKGFAAQMPGVPDTLNVYTIDPTKIDQGSELDCWDLLGWVGDSLTSFNWEECREFEDSAWWEGWDTPDSFGFLSRRVGNLLVLLHYELVDLPPVPAFTESEIIEHLKTRRGETYCDCATPSDLWTLRLTAAGTLEVHKNADGSVTPITSEHINRTGGVTLDGKCILHRTTWKY